MNETPRHASISSAEPPSTHDRIGQQTGDEGGDPVLTNAERTVLETSLDG